MIFKTGDLVRIKCDGREVDGKVIIASKNGMALALEFEAILHGHAGMMPVLEKDGGYISLMGAHPVEISPRDGTVPK